EGVKDPAPLTVRGLDFNNIIGLVNDIQAELPKEGKLEPGEDAAREIVEVMRRASDWDLEVNKFYTRAERVRGKIEAGDPDAAAFFENYAKKSFQDTEFATFEGFKAAVEEGRYLGKAEELAMRTAEKRFAAGRKVDDHVRELIDARVRARNIPQDLPPFAGATALMQRQATTDGERMMGDKHEAMVTTENLAAAASGEEAERFWLRAQAARLEYQIETARRDKGTGLLERGVHYEHLEKAIEEGKDVATVFVDMGFLKYFDQMGGSDVGDVALKTAASMMEQAVKDAGVEGKVYRYGGDEFTIQVEGGDAAANRVIAALEAIREASDPIAVGAKSRSEYAPTQLAFNYGLADRKMLDDLHGLAVREGKYSPEELEDPARVRNAKAELMTKAADVGIEYNKAYSRFMLLIDKIREPAYASDPERKKQVDAMVSFSNKALFAELGGADKLRALAADRSLEGEALEEQILDYVVDKVAETRAREKGQHDLLDLLLAAQVKVAFLTDRLRDMEGIADIQEHKIEALQTSLRKAEEEKRQLIETRGVIDRAA
ncbi:MAG TPA: diguanylate cyclase, partial [Candidatus Baltobacteraceae bacterium]|nr:diguanylate cyclase [Candidatus Baltobacteraceae bacterium]